MMKLDDDLHQLRQGAHQSLVQTAIQVRQEGGQEHL